MVNPADIAARRLILNSATTRLLDAVDRPIDPRSPSLLADWTIGHLLTHLARNADAQRNLLHWANSGQRTPMYPEHSRKADIEAGSGRPLADLVADVRVSAERLESAIDELPAGAWRSVIETGSGGPVNADVVLDHRLGEVELHHHDLGIDEGIAQLDGAAGTGLLAAILRSYVRTREVPGLVLAPDGAEVIIVGGRENPTRVAGSAGSLVAWLTGRDAGTDLEFDGARPVLPAW